MRIIQPSVELMRDFDGEEVLKFIERCGRTCYQSYQNITPDSAEKFVSNLIKRGHESVLEHFSVTFRIICDRGILAELTRHRLASFSVESTRYTAYNGGLTFVDPCYWGKSFPNYSKKICRAVWTEQMEYVERSYREMLSEGARPEEARAILPNSLKTEIIMTANLREWRHILKLRTNKSAHPQMRQIANMILEILRGKIPVVFSGVEEC